MSLSKTIIDPASKQTLTFKRRAPSSNSDGDPVTTLTTVTTAIGDLQPERSIIKESQEGSVEFYSIGTVTHTAYVEERVSGVMENDLIYDENGVAYQILFIHDFKGAPQEFDLRRFSE